MTVFVIVWFVLGILGTSWAFRIFPTEEGKPWFLVWTSLLGIPFFLMVLFEVIKRGLEESK